MALTDAQIKQISGDVRTVEIAGERSGAQMAAEKLAVDVQKLTNVQDRQAAVKLVHDVSARFQAGKDENGNPMAIPPGGFPAVELQDATYTGTVEGGGIGKLHSNAVNVRWKDDTQPAFGVQAPDAFTKVER